MPIVILGWLGVYFVFGNMVADTVPGLDERNSRTHDWSCGVSYCGYKGAMFIPWPFRRGKVRECSKAGDKNRCTGEVYNGKWWYKP